MGRFFEIVAVCCMRAWSYVTQPQEFPPVIDHGTAPHEQIDRLVADAHPSSASGGEASTMPISGVRQPCSRQAKPDDRAKGSALARVRAESCGPSRAISPAFRAPRLAVQRYQSPLEQAG